MKKTIKTILKEKETEERRLNLIETKKSNKEGKEKEAIEYILQTKGYEIFGFLFCLVIASIVAYLTVYGKWLDWFGRLLLSFLAGGLLIAITIRYVKFIIKEKYIKD